MPCGNGALRFKCSGFFSAQEEEEEEEKEHEKWHFILVQRNPCNISKTTNDSNARKFCTDHMKLTQHTNAHNHIIMHKIVNEIRLGDHFMRYKTSTHCFCNYSWFACLFIAIGIKYRYTHTHQKLFSPTPPFESSILSTFCALECSSIGSFSFHTCFKYTIIFRDSHTSRLARPWHFFISALFIRKSYASKMNIHLYD